MRNGRQVLPGYALRLGGDNPLPMDSGVSLAPVTLAYQTYGKLNADKSNAILICHALTGDQFPAEPHPITGKEGWWETIIGLRSAARSSPRKKQEKRRLEPR